MSPLHEGIFLTIGVGRTLKTPKTTYTQKSVFSVMCTALEGRVGLEICMFCAFMIF